MAIENFDQVTIAPAKLRPFSKFIMSIGELPTSYLDSLSYAEQVTWFCDYLQNQVIPALNNNATALEEVQNLMTELQEYVDNYLTEENLQPMINTKLDDMVEDGTMARIINDEVFTALSNRVTKLETPKTMIVIGDSYSNNAQSGTPLWYTYVAKWLGLNVYTNASDGVGYATGTNTFTNQLSRANSYFTDKSVIDRIYIVGGLNDLGNANLTNSQFLQAVNSTINTAITYFPNIPIYVVGIFPFQYYNFYSGTTALSNNRAYEFEKYLAYACQGKDVCFLPAGTVGLNCNDFFGDANQYNQKHPSARGEKIIANYIMNGTMIGGTANLDNTNFKTMPYSITNGNNEEISLSLVRLGTDYITATVSNYDNTKELLINLPCLPLKLGLCMVRQGQGIYYAEINANYQIKIIINNTLSSGNLLLEIPLCFDPQRYLR